MATAFYRYTDPQEAGNRSDIRWATLTSPVGGASLRVDGTGKHLLGMSVYPCAAVDITLAMHPADLPKRDFYTLNLDHLQSGVAGKNSWGALALPKYQIPSGKVYKWSFLLTPTDSPVVRESGASSHDSRSVSQSGIYQTNCLSDALSSSGHSRDSSVCGFSHAGSRIVKS